MEEKKDRGKNSSQNNTFAWYRLFFGKYTLIGIIFLLISIVISLSTQNNSYDIKKTIFDIFCMLLQTLGVAFIMGSIFDFSKNTNEFTEFISNLLSNIVISKEFLSKLTKEDKTNALSLILNPTNNQLEQYSNIKEYFLKKIDGSTKMFITNFKSHLSINLTAKYDVDGKIIVTGIMRYRIYKIQDKYEPLVIIFDNNQGQLTKRRILYPDGIIDISLDEINSKLSENRTEGGLDYKEYIYEIPNELIKYKYLTIESEIKEFGHDHWIFFNWISLTPYDGLSYSLVCEDDLVIKEKILFDNKNQYFFNESADRKNLDICSTDWLDPYTGFSIVVAKSDT